MNSRMVKQQPQHSSSLVPRLCVTHGRIQLNTTDEYATLHTLRFGSVDLGRQLTSRCNTLSGLQREHQP